MNRPLIMCYLNENGILVFDKNSLTRTSNISWEGILIISNNAYHIKMGIIKLSPSETM